MVGYQVVHTFYNGEKQSHHWMTVDILTKTFWESNNWLDTWTSTLTSWWIENYELISHNLVKHTGDYLPENILTAVLYLLGCSIMYSWVSSNFLWPFLWCHIWDEAPNYECKIKRYNKHDLSWPQELSYLSLSLYFHSIAPISSYNPWQ